MLPEGPQSSGTAERFELQERQVASLSAQALFIFTVALFFPMAPLVGTGSLVILKCWDFVFAGGNKDTLIELF